MRKPFKASRAAAPFILATAALSLSSLHCSSEDTTPVGTAGTGAIGGSAGAAQGGMSGTATLGGSGGATAGAPTAGSAGTPTAGAAGTAGSGGQGGSAGAGGTGGGGAGGGGAGGGGAGGGPTVTFAQVKDVLAMSCKGAQCHDAPSTHVDWTTADGLYMRLTSPIPADAPHCVGDTPIVSKDLAKSLLYQAVKGGQFTCTKKGGGTEMIPQMPDDCPGERACLTADKIKLIGDWITAGAPM